MSNVTPLFNGRRGGGSVLFDRNELNLIMNVYGRMVSEGLWRDYTIDTSPEQAAFSAFRRASERPEISIVKRPELASRQGQYALIGQAGAVLRRAHTLGQLLATIERKLLKLVEA